MKRIADFTANLIAALILAALFLLMSRKRASSEPVRLPAGCGKPIEHARVRDSSFYELPCAIGTKFDVVVKP